MNGNDAKSAKFGRRWKAVMTLAAAFVAMGLSLTEAYAKALDMVPEEPDVLQLLQTAVTSTSADYGPFNQGIFADDKSGQHSMAAATINREWAQWELWTTSGPPTGETAVQRVLLPLTNVSAGSVSLKSALYIARSTGEDEFT